MKYIYRHHAENKHVISVIDGQLRLARRNIGSKVIMAAAKTCKLELAVKRLT